MNESIGSDLSISASIYRTSTVYRRKNNCIGQSTWGKKKETSRNIYRMQP